MLIPALRRSSLHSLQLHTDYSLTFSEFWDTLRHSTFDLRTVTNFGSTSVFHFQVSNLLNHLLLTDFASSPGCTLHHLTFDSSTITTFSSSTYLHDRMSFNPRQALPSAQSLQQRPYSLLVQPSTVFVVSPNLSQVLQHTSLPWYSSILLLLGISCTAFAERSAHPHRAFICAHNDLQLCCTIPLHQFYFSTSLLLGMSSTASAERSAHPQRAFFCTYNDH